MLSSGEGVAIQLSDHPMSLPALDLVDLDGRAITNASLAGKVVLLNFWATWCGPCREEIPMLAALQKHYGDRLAIVGLSIDESPAEDVRTFAAGLGVNYPVVMSTRALEAEFGGITAVPSTFVVDRSGPDCPAPSRPAAGAAHRARSAGARGFADERQGGDRERHRAGASRQRRLCDRDPRHRFEAAVIDAARADAQAAERRAVHLRLRADGRPVPHQRSLLRSQSAGREEDSRRHGQGARTRIVPPFPLVPVPRSRFPIPSVPGSRNVRAGRASASVCEYHYIRIYG